MATGAAHDDFQAEEYDVHLRRAFSNFGSYLGYPSGKKRNRVESVDRRQPTSQESNSSDIDFVITWVDSNDPKWQKAFETHKNGEPAIGRYRDMETLRYVFRSFELFTPWVRKIHFVTFGHTPSWLNLRDPRINIVRHEDILPKEALPTFNIGAIEMALGNIAGLSEKFVYFNDDLFMIKPTSEERFFVRDLPKDFFHVGTLYHDQLFSHQIHELMTLVSRTFRTKDVFTRRMIPKVFSLHYGIVANVRTFLSLIVSRTLSNILGYHHPQPHLTTNLHEVYRAYSDEVAKVRLQKFPQYNSIFQYTYRFWGLINGRFVPYRVRDALYRGIASKDDIDAAIEEAKNGRYRFVCFNDVDTLSDDEYSYFKESVREFLEELFAKPCSYELGETK